MAIRMIRYLQSLTTHRLRLTTHHSRLTILLAALIIAGRALAADVPPRPSAGCGASAIDTGGKIERTIVIDGVRRSYILDVPARITAGSPVPLLFDFHGFGHSAAGAWKVSGFRELGARDRFITVYLDGLPVHFFHHGRPFDGAGWEIRNTADNRDVQFVRQLLDQLEHTYCIDRARVFATGFSMGAYFSHLLGCVMADRFAAIAPVSGGQVPEPCAPARPVPVLIHHGRQDDMIDVDQGRQARDRWIALDHCEAQSHSSCERHDVCRDGAVVEYCEGDFAHHWPPEATARVWQFFTQHPMR
ncbi:MAG TPA: hypothetical protein VMW17_04605 [Candidatus Binatia bacterium]|nr:hypothetical protein [Candidatus Binatia bacterium]